MKENAKKEPKKVKKIKITVTQKVIKKSGKSIPKKATSKKVV